MLNLKISTVKKWGLDNYLLVFIFLIGILVRFVNFRQSTYFGFDEARDAYISQAIYQKGDIKLIGPPANATGLFHGPLAWYIFGPFNIVAKGNPYFLSFIFRLFNALGIFLIYFLTKKLFDKKTALISSSLYAVSFEQSQYAMYVCNPYFAVFSWFAIFYGAAILLKDKKKFWGLPLMVGGVTSAMQFLLLSFNTIFVFLFLALMLYKQIKKISLGSFILSFVVGLMFTSSYIISEIMFNFREMRTAFSLLKSGYSLMPEGETKFGLYIKRFVLLFKDNLLPINGLLLSVLAILILSTLFFLVIKKKNMELILILSWIFGSLPFVFLGIYNGYYLNIGIGLGVIISIGYLLNWINIGEKLKISLLIVILIINFLRIYRQSSDSLIADIKPQPYMKLADELRLIDKMYELSDKRGFTIRITGIPYRVQTVWAYLFDYYGKKRYGYYPYLETGVVEGFQGKLPVPIKGSTCVRFLVQEPERGIPKELIQKDIEEENLFSTIVNEEKFGHFILQYRQSNSKDCHNILGERL